MSSILENGQDFKSHFRVLNCFICQNKIKIIKTCYQRLVFKMINVWLMQQIPCFEVVTAETCTWKS